MSESSGKWMKIVLGMAVLSLVGGGAGGYFLYEEYNGERDQAKQLQAQIDQVRVLRARVPSLENDVIRLRENVEEYVKILPSERQINEFVNKIHDFSEAAGVKVTNIKSKKDRTRKQRAFERVIYRMDLNGTYDELLTFANLFESYERFMNVTAISMSSGEVQDDNFLEVRHPANLEVETYVYASQTKSEKVEIPNYERKRDTLQDEILSARHQIPIETYALTENPLRRDIMVDPRLKPSAESDTGLPLEEQRGFITWTRDTIDEVKALADLQAQTKTILRRLEIESQLRERVVVLNQKVGQSLDEGWVTDPPLRRRLEKEIVPNAQKLLREYGQATGAESLAAEELLRVKEAMEADFQKGHYERCTERYEICQGRIRQTVLDDRSREYLEVMTAIHTAAQSAIEFEGIEISISGRIVQEQDSVVIINGRVFQEGESVDDHLAIHRIFDDRVEFRFRGVVLSRAL